MLGLKRRRRFGDDRVSDDPMIDRVDDDRRPRDTVREGHGVGAAAPPGYEYERPPAYSREDYTETRTEWSFGQVIGLVVGLASLIVGGIALARTGLDFSDVNATHTEVLGLHHTSVLALSEVIFGALVLAGALIPGGYRGMSTVLALVSVAFGIVVLADPDSLHDTFGVHEANGVVLLIAGALLLLAAAMPVSTRMARRVR